MEAATIAAAVAAELRRRGIEYLARVPEAVPPGKIIVHNRVRPRASRQLGRAGFRAWLSEPSDEYERRKCGWAQHLSEHYRVKRVKQQQPKGECT